MALIYLFILSVSDSASALWNTHRIALRRHRALEHGTRVLRRHSALERTSAPGAMSHRAIQALTGHHFHLSHH
jgi:hypothetical protein